MSNYFTNQGYATYTKYALSALLGLSLNMSASAHNFVTNINYPDLNEGKIFKPTFNPAYKLVFYTGRKNGENYNGYFSSQNYLGWVDYKFPPLEWYQDIKQKGILSVAKGPANNTLALSYVDNVGQLLSTSSDGKTWRTLELKVNNDFFNKLISTTANGMNRVIAYGRNQSLFMTSNDGFNWMQWAFPSSCFSEDNCTTENKYFGDSFNYYVLFQSRKLDNVNSNRLYFTSNLQNWYYKPVPFTYNAIQKVFKSNNETLSVVTLDAKNNNQLWLTPDLENWVNFDLPKDATVADLKVFNPNNIGILLIYNVLVDNNTSMCLDGGKCPGDQQPSDNSNGDTDPTPVPGPVNYKKVTEFVSLDPETKTLTVLHKFDGEVTGMEQFDNKFYLTGNFVNRDDQKSAALVSTNSSIITK